MKPNLSVIDPLRDKNKRLCGLLREALPRLVKGIVYDKIEQELSK